MRSLTLGKRVRLPRVSVPVCVVQAPVHGKLNTLRLFCNNIPLKKVKVGKEGGKWGGRSALLCKRQKVDSLMECSNFYAHQKKDRSEDRGESEQCIAMQCFLFERSLECPHVIQQSDRQNVQCAALHQMTSRRMLFGALVLSVRKRLMTINLVESDKFAVTLWVSIGEISSRTSYLTVADKTLMNSYIF